MCNTTVAAPKSDWHLQIKAEMPIAKSVELTKLHPAVGLSSYVTFLRQPMTSGHTALFQCKATTGNDLFDRAKSGAKR